MLRSLKEIYSKNYKYLMVIPVLLLILSISVIGYWYNSTGEFISKDVSLKGGIMITLETNQDFDIEQLKSSLESELKVSANVKELKSVSGGIIGYTFEVESTQNSEIIKSTIEKITGINLAQDNYTIEETSPTLSKAFWQGTLKALLIAFAFMAAVVFFYFRKVVPSFAIVLAAVSDFLFTIAMINLIDIKLSTAGVAALLMLVGYSVDSDILLSTRVLKHTEGTIVDRIIGAIKTGLTMQGTTLTVLLIIIILPVAFALKQIAIILIIGLLIDVPNTWLMNAGILRWYLEKKHG